MNWLKYKTRYLLFSSTLVLLSATSLATWRLELGIDFVGGTLLEYKLADVPSTEVVKNAVEEVEAETVSVQKTTGANYLIKLPEIDSNKREALRQKMTSKFGEVEELRYEVVGPSIGPELVKKTIYAIFISAVAILLWVAIQFKNFRFGLAAILAMLHDTFILVGTFSLFGKFFGAQVDFLFVTALLTTLSFSVHDTIVVFDRIREVARVEGGNLEKVSNQALSETFVRSLNNSFTIVFMLLALLLMGGTTIKWFATALLIGTVLGTYSSPFVAVPLLNLFNTKKP